MHMQSNVHNASVLHCANVYTAHSTILLMHNSAHIAQCTHDNASQQCSVMDREGADQSVKCWRERTKCYSCALNYIICKTYCRRSYTILCTFHKAHSFLFSIMPTTLPGLVAPKEIFSRAKKTKRVRVTLSGLLAQQPEFCQTRTHKCTAWMRIPLDWLSL